MGALMIMSILAVFMLSATTYAKEPSSAAQLEIAHLLDYLSASGCEFYRNGKWYTAEAARSHIEEKYQYLLKKQFIGSAEDFISKAATQSSISGEPYQVRCGNNVFPSAVWLMEELMQLRQKQTPSQ